MIVEAPDMPEIIHIDIAQRDISPKDTGKSLDIPLPQSSTLDTYLFSHRLYFLSLKANYHANEHFVNLIDIQIHEQPILIEQSHGIMISVHGAAPGPYPYLIT